MYDKVVSLDIVYMVKIHRKFCFVNGLGIGICSAVSKHYTCLYLSTGLKGEESGLKPKWLYLEDTSFLIQHSVLSLLCPNQGQFVLSKYSWMCGLPLEHS